MTGNFFAEYSWIIIGIVCCKILLVFFIDDMHKYVYERRRKITFQINKLISNCPPLYDETGEIAAPIAIRLFVWTKPEHSRL